MAHIDLLHILKKLKNRKNFVFLWNGKNDKDNFTSFLFTNPVKIIMTKKYSQLEDCFKNAERLLKKGYYIAGYLSFEAASSFEKHIRQHNPVKTPLIWLGIYKKPAVYHCKKGAISLPVQRNYDITCLKPALSKKKYLSKIKKIKNLIKKGLTYQVNFTYKYNFQFQGSVRSFFMELGRQQPVSYGALIDTGENSILSLSPELFFRKKNSSMTMKPMKGTIERGRTCPEDKRKESELFSSKKDRAENVMIVDMLRNDLGKISKKGFVKVRKLFETEKYRTLYQMTSTIKSKLEKASLFEIFKNTFPSGSVTGAPKIETIKIIKALEKKPRNIYTGSIGCVFPNGDSVFNVAIRTILLDKKTGKGEMGVGSGVTMSSDPAREYEECRLKADFLVKKNKSFKLIETILWTKGKFSLLRLHLKRLKESAQYFDFFYNSNKVIKGLLKIEKKFKKNRSYKVRLLLDECGNIDISFSGLMETRKGIRKAAFSGKTVKSEDIFLYHKTTNRRIYDEEYKKCKNKGLFDVLFTNEKGEVTEGAISNIIIKKGNRLFTPRINCGLLNGIYREHLLKKRGFRLKEKSLCPKDLLKADKIFLCNSVRGTVEVRIV